MHFLVTTIDKSNKPKLTKRGLVRTDGLTLKIEKLRFYKSKPKQG